MRLKQLFSILKRIATAVPTCLLLLVVVAGCKNDEAEKKDAAKPNIIILFADDLGYGDLGAYGHPTIRTPNLDKMAREGMKFTQFYSTASICTPSRGALLTGRYPVRTGIHTGVYFPQDTLGIPVEELTIAEALQQNGYTTACFGKWHLGHREGYLPVSHGFDRYLGIPYSNDMWAKRGKSYPPLPLIKGQDIIEEEPDQSKLTALYTDAAIEFINENKETPFLLYLPYTFPHVPLFASEKFRGKSLRGLYGDVVEEIDWSVGQILQALQQNGLSENTLVFFTSDNGPWLSENEEGGTAGLLREGKGSCWEGGMRVPAIAWWPGHVPSGKVNYNLTCTMDLFPALIQVSGTTVEEDLVLDGNNMLPTLLNDSISVRDHFFYYHGADLYAVRNGKWKVHYKTVENMYTPEVVFQEHDPPLLFNLETDPSELFDLAEKYPQVLEEMRALVSDHRQNLVIKPSVIR